VGQAVSPAKSFSATSFNLQADFQSAPLRALQTRSQDAILPHCSRYSVSMAPRKTPVMARLRDRSHLVSVVDQWQINHIRQGLREANAGRFASKAEVSRVISRLRLKSS